jgi:hypothetical protein
VTVMEAFAQEMAELPVGQALQTFHCADGSWRLVRLVFGPSLLSPIRKYVRDGATLEDAAIAQETEEKPS